MSKAAGSLPICVCGVLFNWAGAQLWATKRHLFVFLISAVVLFVMQVFINRKRQDLHSMAFLVGVRRFGSRCVCVWGGGIVAFVRFL